MCDFWAVSDQLPDDSAVCYTRGERNARAAAARFERPPMSVDAATVRRIAHLARIAVADDEVEHLRGEINAILAFVEQLSEVDVSHVEPMTSVMPMEMKKRADVVTDGGDAEAVLRNAPVTERNYFLVPKVVE
jgi:aspartyl-tRNA(Asn)/glutamyl-tRNA(Gln) amidotransferase subunit C